MTPTTAELTRLRHMASIAKWTNDDNRAFHHAMIDAGWIPACDLLGIREWGNYRQAVLYDYQDAMNFYIEHGQAPAPF